MRQRIGRPCRYKAPPVSPCCSGWVSMGLLPLNPSTLVISPLWAAHSWCLARDLPATWVTSYGLTRSWLCSSGMPCMLRAPTLVSSPMANQPRTWRALKRDSSCLTWNLMRRSKRSILSTIRRRLSWISDGWWILKNLTSTDERRCWNKSATVPKCFSRS